MHRIALTAALTLCAHASLAQCDLATRYAAEVETREARQESLADLYTRWHAQLIVAMDQQQTPECGAWIRSELLALCNALRDDARALALAREQLQAATSCRAQLKAGNEYVGALLNAVGRDMDRVHQLECRAAAQIALEGCPPRDQMLADPTLHPDLTYATPMLHVVASTEADASTRQQSLRDLLTFIESVQQTTTLQLATDHRNVLGELALLHVDADNVNALRPLLDQLGDGASGKGRAALAFIARRGIAEGTPMGDYLHELALNSDVAAIRLRILAKRALARESALAGRQDAPLADVQEFFDAQQRVLECVAACRADAAANRNVELEVPEESLRSLEANARYEIYAKLRWFVKDNARATEAANEFLDAFPADVRAESVTEFLAGE